MMVKIWRLQYNERVRDDMCLGFSSLMEMINMLGFIMVFVSVGCGLHKVMEIEWT